MKRIPMTPDLSSLPSALLPYFDGATVFDSSCSKAAQVWLIQPKGVRQGGYYLKQANAGSLSREAAMDAFFFEKGFGPEVLACESNGDRDYLLTRALAGEDLTHADCLADPRRLAAAYGKLLRILHDTAPKDCPCLDLRSDCFGTVRDNFCNRRYDLTLFQDRCTFATPEEAFSCVEANIHRLEINTLLHGDYCRPMS